MKGFLDLVRRILYRYDIEIAEVQSIWAKVLLGIAFLINLPPKSDAGYDALIAAIDFRLFAVVTIAIGVVHTIGMVKDNINHRRLASLLSCVVWSYLTVVIGLTHDMFALLSSTFALSSALVYLRLTGILSRSQRREGNDEGIPTIPGVSIERTTSLPTRSLD